MSFDLNSTYICATTRLARALRTELNQAQKVAGHSQWQTPNILTLQQWLQETCTFPMLSGEVAADYFPNITLNSFTEKLLWQTAIEQCLAKHELVDLFNIPNLAQLAMEANRYMIDWGFTDAQINTPLINNETRQFLRWRAVFHSLCKQLNALEPARLFALQVDVIAQTRLPLPQKMVWLGYDRITPLEQRLIDTLDAKDVSVTVTQAYTENQQLVQFECDDLTAECRTAIAWAKQKLDANPQANLAIISPVLSNIRRVLADLLDDTFHPESLSNYEADRIYDFSLGLALSELAMVGTALNLLRLCATRNNIEQPDISALLLDVHWGDLSELDGRSLLDARIRKTFTRTFNLQQLTALIKEKQLHSHIQYILDTQQRWSKAQLPSAWAAAFTEALSTLNWMQTRPLSSHEHQARKKWLETLASFAALDKLVGTIKATEAMQKLQQLCSTTIFQPEAGEGVRIQVLGILESLVRPIDAIWVIGMNDQHWPPPAAPNALLPAALQRDLQTPGANPDAQFVFAENIHRRLCSSAVEVNFSWSRKDGERELRVSPLLASISVEPETPAIETLAEKLATPVAMEMLDDSLAPAISATEQVHGGSKLLETQAICPAWAFYQYRLGAKKLKTPTEGLDNMARGNLVHAVLQYFWLDCKDSGTLKSLSAAALQANIDAAISKALQTLKNELSINLPAQIITIERCRLQQLIQTWLELEKQRTDFSVQACEATHTLHIEGLEITCRIDRIDALEDGGLVVIDYKTGSPPALKTWSETRIHEPQLPLYASLALQNQQVVAACFAHVNNKEAKFSGISAVPEHIPGISAFGKLRSDSPFLTFENLNTLIAHWQNSLQSIALEIKNGVATVQFTDQNDLLYCDVKPLLRLPERALQFEQKK